MNGADALVYFFDTSALVKRYHREKGTALVDAAFKQQEAVRLISDLSVIEAYSAFAKKVRTNEITEEDFHLTIRAIAADVRGGTVELIPFGDEDKREAVALIEAYGVSKSLRTLDAMQLAIMKRQATDRITRVYCADQRFVEVLEQEGFFVIDPEQAPHQ